MIYTLREDVESLHLSVKLKCLPLLPLRLYRSTVFIMDSGSIFQGMEPLRYIILY